MNPELKELWAIKRSLIQERNKLLDKLFFMWRPKLQAAVASIDKQIDAVADKIKEMERR